jgi:hypothetical protein
MRRLWALVVLLVVGWLAFGAPASAAVEPPTGILAYTYDQPHHVAAPAHAATERVPPVSTYVDTAHATVDRWSRGAAARLQAVTAWPTTTQTVPAGFVQVARPTTTTSGDAVEIDGDLGALRRWQVAAESGTSAAERALARLPKAARQSEKPPGFNPETWQWREGSRTNVPRSWWDPEGGEWRFHPADKRHDPHWDYNPWEQRNHPWQHLYPGD